MRKLLVICFSVLLILWITTSAYSYTANVSCFFEGVVLETGEKAQDPTILVVIFGEPEEIEQVLQPSTPMTDFASPFNVGFSFMYNPQMTNPILLFPENAFQIAMVDTTFDLNNLSTLDFQDVSEKITFDSTKILLLKTSSLDIMKIGIAYLGNLDVEINVERLNSNPSPIPEPTTLTLVGLGLLSGGIWVMNKKRKDAQVKSGIFMGLIFLVMIGVTTSAFAQQETFTIKKAGSGTGTIVIGEQTCDVNCLELSVPYSLKTAIVLKAIPYGDSVFVGWKKQDATSATGKLYAQPGDLVFAVFEKQVELPQPPATYIGFGMAMSDEAIVQLLERHSITPKSALIWISGLNGTHRVYESIDPKSFVEEIRISTRTMLEETIETNFMRLVEIVEQCHENDVIQNEELQEYVRSLLNIRIALTNGLDATRKGAPLIFSLEIDGTPEQLENLSKEAMVKAISGDSEENSTAPTMIPEVYQQEFLDPTVQGMSPQQLYQQAKTLVEGSLSL